MPGLISVIITTYNWPAALAACLQSLLAQQDSQFEIIIADDGSTQTTRELIASLAVGTKIHIQHVWHEDKGFRAGTIRNKAVTECKGDYIVFVDGDCVVFPNYISRHRVLAEAGFFVPGNRLLLSEHFTQQVLQENIALHSQTWAYFFKLRLNGKINRLLPLLHIRINQFRYWHPKRWQNAMACNLAFWKEDLIKVNGFDEIFEGWGFEDSDLVIRLIHLGIKRKEGRFALPVLHLWHKQNDRSQHDTNYQRLLERLQDESFFYSKLGVNQYLKAD